MGGNADGDKSSWWSLTLTAGRVGFDNADVASAQTRGSFAKWMLTASDQQRLTANGSLYVALSA